MMRLLLAQNERRDDSTAYARSIQSAPHTIVFFFIDIHSYIRQRTSSSSIFTDEFIVECIERRWWTSGCAVWIEIAIKGLVESLLTLASHEEPYTQSQKS